MRRIVLSLIVLAVVFSLGFFAAKQHYEVGTVSMRTHSGLPLPKLQEKFTPLPCGTTTIGMEGCAEQDVLALDASIDHLRSKIFSHLFDTAAKRRFDTAEVDWLTYRQSTCASVSDRYEGGSLAPVVFANCLNILDREHVHDLDEELTSYQQS